MCFAQKRPARESLVSEAATARLLPREFFVKQDYLTSGSGEFRRGKCAGRTSAYDCYALRVHIHRHFTCARRTLKLFPRVVVDDAVTPKAFNGRDRRGNKNAEIAMRTANLHY